MSAAAAWEARHPGFTASAPVRRWLALLEPLARRLQRVPPAGLTALGVCCAGGAAASAVADRRRLGAVLLPVGGLCDGLDGMVASLRGGSTDAGRRLDHAADRVADAALMAGLGALGAPRWLCAAALGAVVAQEAARDGSTRVTPGERPTRILLGMLGFCGAPRVATAGIALVCGGSAVTLARSSR